MKKVGIVTTSRADFGLLYPIIKEIDKSELLETKVIATGLHLLKEHGNSIKHVEKKCKNVDKIDLFMPNIDKFTLVKSIGIGFISFSEYFKNNDFDGIIVLGDRTELIVPVYSAMICDIPIIHIFGGDSIDNYVTYDNNIRHCITKLANIHLAATKQHAERIKKLGEENWRIFNVGSPAVDYIRNCDYLDKKQLQMKFTKINFNNPYCVLTFHPVPTEIDRIKNQIGIIIESLRENNIQVICTKPNNDLGYEYILEEIEKEDFNNKSFLLINSISQEEYYSILKYSDFMIGNSSSGILESSSFKIPSINIGNRQLGRVKSENVIDISHDKNDIIKAIQKCRYNNLFKESCKKCKNPYGDGNAAYKIVKILEDLLDNKNKLLIKKITY
ncbi:UDP-N-acetylglucosamine 2-epimerase (hydrolyzing) [Clostridium sp. MSJ-4]|uniref:UDP-N-acetylglucosamine 2-epimerase (Hydrolyzing) n=1 Tax=Clostridium simiarum TaxID=2841506 RepID=A0ABS6EXZ6_9CLOT|nr:UDP-N-acetylglucosamine 2-epimerase [Clostridium simiarum]MBU5591094.1 UDP-N-acetylglucosamine 2-epimerase (hydrolyzing) [Clostridium simiarum]